LVESLGGAGALADYLGLDEETVTAALNAPDRAWKDRTAKKVEGMTEILRDMRARESRSLFSRYVRWQVARDWRNLARWSETERVGYG
jgi:hypothetical protein